MKNHYFRDGDNVAHKEYLTLKMTVKRSIFKLTKNPVDGSDVKKFIGLECEWWENKVNEEGKIIRRHTFHSRELIPWDVAVKGEKVIKKFLTGEAGANDDNPTKEKKSKKNKSMVTG